MKFIIKNLFVSSQHNWRTRILSSVFKYQKTEMFQQMSMTTPFPDPLKQEKILEKMVCIAEKQFLLTIHTMTNDSCLVQLFGLCSSRSWSTVIMSKGGHS